MGEVAMIDQLTKKQKLIILASLLFVAGAIALVGFMSSRFKVVSTDPSNNGKINTYNSVILTYDRDITADNARIVFQPEVFYKKRIDGNRLIITPSLPLENATNYTVTVERVCDKNATATCIDYKLAFLTDNTIPFEELSEEQRKEVVRETDAEFNESPILAILPVRETEFLIDAEPVGEFIYILITPNVLAKNLTEEEYNAAYAEYYQAGRKYLENKGYDLETSKYKVVSRNEYMAMW
jgi:hypothetical protein